MSDSVASIERSIVDAISEGALLSARSLNMVSCSNVRSGIGSPCNLIPLRPEGARWQTRALGLGSSGV